MEKEVKKRGRPKKVILDDALVDRKPTEKITFANNNELVPKAPEMPVIEVADELAPVENESAEHKRVREVYIMFRQSNPKVWELDKKNLLDKLSKL